MSRIAIVVREPTNVDPTTTALPQAACGPYFRGPYFLGALANAPIATLGCASRAAKLLALVGSLVIGGLSVPATAQTNFPTSHESEPTPTMVTAALDWVIYASAIVDGVKIAYREAGSPADPKLVLLHGFPAASHQYRNLVTALADRFHVIAPDYPGSATATHSIRPTSIAFMPRRWRATIRLVARRQSAD